ncbi:MAG TPA: LysR family transcriptional regulator [Facklamia tabacinasalis]|nr:LysR family transcriptional regulator [Ruoffia tabacinasalis]
MMEISQMQYFVEIVQSDCNLTVAAENLYVSQSALSQFIKNFEHQQGVSLFNRKNGRIVNVSDSGMHVYQSALKVLNQYNGLEHVIERESLFQKGTIKIGIHPTYLRFFFNKFIPRFLIENPDAHIEIVEAGTNELQQMLEDNVIHIAVLAPPKDFDTSNYEVHPLVRTEVVAFMGPEHPLVTKRLLKWNHLDNYHYVTYNKKDAVYYFVEDKLKENNSTAKQLFTSSSWDYMIETVIYNELIALLPTVYFSMFISRLNQIGVVEKRFEDPIPYIPTLMREKKQHYSKVEDFVFQSIYNNFHFENDTLKYDFLLDD